MLILKAFIAVRAPIPVLPGFLTSVLVQLSFQNVDYLSHITHR